MTYDVLMTLIGKVLEAGMSMSPVPFTVSKIKSAKESFKHHGKTVIGKIGHADFRIKFDQDDQGNVTLNYLSYDNKVIKVGLGNPTIASIVHALIDAYNNDPVSEKVAYLKR